MEKNTVNLSLADYNSLRDFQTQIESGKFLLIKSHPEYYWDIRIFGTESEVISRLVMENEKMHEELRKYRDKMFFRQMSWLAFRRWRKSL